MAVPPAQKQPSQASGSAQPQYPPALALPPPPPTTGTAPTTPGYAYPNYPPSYYPQYAAVRPGVAPTYVAPFSPTVPPPTPGVTPGTPQQAYYGYPYAQQPGGQAYGGGYLNSPAPTPGQFAFGSQQTYPYSPRPGGGAATAPKAAVSVVGTSAATGTTPAATGTATTGGRGGRRQQPNIAKGIFTAELRDMMYGFGDDAHPAQDTVDVMEEIVMDYMKDVYGKALAGSKKSTVKVDDLRRVLKRPADSKKLGRMAQMFAMAADQKKARKQFAEDEIGKDAQEADGGGSTVGGKRGRKERSEVPPDIKMDLDLKL